MSLEKIARDIARDIAGDIAEANIEKSIEFDISQNKLKETHKDEFRKNS